MIDFLGKNRYFLIVSAALIVVGIVFAAVNGIPWGIDFTGGTILTLEFDQEVTQADLEAEFAKVGHEEALVQETGGNTYIIRIKELQENERDQLIPSLEAMGLTDKRSIDSVSNAVAKEKVWGAGIAVAVAAVIILLYISWAFRKVPRPMRYGTCAIIALVHDVLIALAVFSILGDYLNLEINLMFVTALLTVIGYSVNDTIVVFDRIRENLGRAGKQGFETVVNNSVVETVTRSLNTSLTTLVVLVAVYLFVGEAIESFMLVLIVGVISGTYSSIFIASQLLVIWETGAVRKLLRRTA